MIDLTRAFLVPDRQEETTLHDKGVDHCKIILLLLKKNVIPPRPPSISATPQPTTKPPLGINLLLSGEAKVVTSTVDHPPMVARPGWLAHPPKPRLDRLLPSLLGMLGSHDGTIDSYSRGGSNGNSGRDEDCGGHGGRDGNRGSDDGDWNSGKSCAHLHHSHHRNEDGSTPGGDGSPVVFPEVLLD